MKGVNVEKSGNRETQIRCRGAKRKATKAVYLAKCEAERNRFADENLIGEMTGYVKCLRLQRGWSKIIKVMLVNSA